MSDPDTLVVADAIQLSTATAKVFGPSTFAVHANAVHLVAGPRGSGRSMLLLALTGRMQGVQGSLTVDGHDAISSSRAVRATTSVARLSGFVDVEDQLTVGEAITERYLMDGVRTQQALDRMTELEDLIGITFERDALVAGLSWHDRTLLSVVLALLRPASLLVLDDLDLGFDDDGLRQILARLEVVAAAEAAIVASVISPPPRSSYAVTDLTPAQLHRSRIK